MNRPLIGIVAAILVLGAGLWLLNGGRVSCRESFWDRNTQVIEIKRE